MAVRERSKIVLKVTKRPQCVALSKFLPLTLMLSRLISDRLESKSNLCLKILQRAREERKRNQMRRFNPILEDRDEEEIVYRSYRGNEQDEVKSTFSEGDTVTYDNAYGHANNERSAGPVVALLCAIVGVVLVFFTCITCCSASRSTSSDEEEDDVEDVRPALTASALSAPDLRSVYYDNVQWAAAHTCDVKACVERQQQQQQLQQQPRRQRLQRQTRMPNKAERLLGGQSSSVDSAQSSPAAFSTARSARSQQPEVNPHRKKMSNRNVLVSLKCAQADSLESHLI